MAGDEEGELAADRNAQHGSAPFRPYVTDCRRPRNEIRLAVGRYERVESTAFTKEALAAICDAVESDIETDRLSPKSEMRASIRRRIGLEDGDDPDRAEGPSGKRNSRPSRRRFGTSSDYRIVRRDGREPDWRAFRSVCRSVRGVSKRFRRRDRALVRFASGPASTSVGSSTGSANRSGSGRRARASPRRRSPPAAGEHDAAVFSLLERGLIRIGKLLADELRRL